MATAQGRRRQLNGCSGGARAAAATRPTVVEVAGSGQGEVVASAAGAATSHICAAAVGLLPRSSFSNHLRGSSLLSFFK